MDEWTKVRDTYREHATHFMYEVLCASQVVPKLHGTHLVTAPHLLHFGLYVIPHVILSVLWLMEAMVACNLHCPSVPSTLQLHVSHTIQHGMHGAAGATLRLAHAHSGIMTASD